MRTPIARPRATYRVQLHAGFTFDDAAAIVGYLARLGISHLYCSPVLQAAPGSAHGYDVVDHSRLSDDLGGAPAYARLCRELAAHDLSLVLDIVPNHMALAGARNQWWWDVLEDGPASRFARHFDIDWVPTATGAGPTVLVPVLGEQYGRVLEAGELDLARRGGSFTVRYHEHELPLSPRSVHDILRSAAAESGSAELAAIADGLSALPPAPATDAIAERYAGKEALRHELRVLAGSNAAVAGAIDARLRAIAADPEALDDLLARQSYRLAHWRTASEELDYRRFFDITTLIGLRAEDPVVFEDTHRLLLDLVAAGDVTGLRVDHVDGLRDPAGYLHRLREAAPEAFVAVEKILAPDEELPASWPVVGTSGYDFLNRVNDVFIDPAGIDVLTTTYAELVDDRPFTELVHEAKQHVMREELAAETERVTDLLVRVCAARRRHRDHTRRGLRDTLREVAAALAVYRTYVVPGAPTSATDRDRLSHAFAVVAERRADLDGELLDLLYRILVLDEPGELEAELAVRFQQLTPPVMAKGVEDTAFYRYARLLSLNEVGGEPGTVGRGAPPLHQHNQATAARWPATMLTLSTHDTKRSADVRARLNGLSEIPHAWMAAVQRWMAHNERHRPDGWVDVHAEVVLYQTLVGAWPVSGERVEAAMAKSANEAKLRTSWRNPSPAYENALRAFVAAVLADGAFVAMLEDFLAAHELVRLGRLTSLAQTTLLLTSPGVPDVYQGDELWDLSLVDPDNRRPVDFEQRRKLLEDLGAAPAADALARADEGGPKLWLITQLLRHRRGRPERYARATYEPLVAQGPMADHVVAFSRGELLVAVPRLVSGPAASGWQGTTLTLPEGAWASVLAEGTRHVGTVRVDDLFGDFPVAVLDREAAS